MLHCNIQRTGLRGGTERGSDHAQRLQSTDPARTGLPSAPNRAPGQPSPRRAARSLAGGISPAPAGRPLARSAAPDARLAAPGKGPGRPRQGRRTLLASYGKRGRGDWRLYQRLKPGTVLVREFSGVRHTVTVAPDGFIWKDSTYSSLSAIAKTITGANWNGPRFFGLRDSRPKSEASEPKAV